MNKILLNCRDVVILANAGGGDFGKNSQYIKSYKMMCLNSIRTLDCTFGRCKRLCQEQHRRLYLDSWCMDNDTCKCKYSC